MGERYTGSVEVMGSNPTVSTKKSLEIIGFQGFFVLEIILVSNLLGTVYKTFPQNPCFGDFGGMI